MPDDTDPGRLSDQLRAVVGGAVGGFVTAGVSCETELPPRRSARVCPADLDERVVGPGDDRFAERLRDAPRRASASRPIGEVAPVLVERHLRVGHDSRVVQRNDAHDVDVVDSCLPDGCSCGVTPQLRPRRVVTVGGAVQGHAQVVRGHPAPQGAALPCSEHPLSAAAAPGARGAVRPEPEDRPLAPPSCAARARGERGSRGTSSPGRGSGSRRRSAERAGSWMLACSRP